MSSKTLQPETAQRPLPPGWRWVRLGETGRLTDGDWILNSDYADHGVRLLQVGDIGVGKFIGKSCRFITMQRAMELRVTFLQEGDILISRMPDPLGRACMLPELGYPSITAVDVSIWRPRSDVVDRQFATYYLNSDEWFSMVASQASGATRPRISRSNLEMLEIPIPPLSEQKRIAGILREQMAAVERARRAAEEQLEAAKALPAAYLRAMFPKAGEPLPPGWRWVRLGEVCEEDRKIVEAHSNLADDLPYLSLEHIESHSGRILKHPTERIEDEGKSTTFVFDSRHVLYGKLRPYLNKVALPNFEGRCTTEIIPLLPTEQIDREFLCWLLRRPETVEAAMKEKTGSRMPRANINELLNLEIPLPPLAEQKRIAGILREQMASVERLRKALEEQLEAINKLPAALLRKAFNGEL